jgi:hypothetical protein
VRVGEREGEAGRYQPRRTVRMILPMLHSHTTYTHPHPLKQPASSPKCIRVGFVPSISHQSTELRSTLESCTPTLPRLQTTCILLPFSSVLQRLPPGASGTSEASLVRILPRESSCPAKIDLAVQSCYSGPSQVILNLSHTEDIGRRSYAASRDLSMVGATGLRRLRHLDLLLADRQETINRCHEQQE